MKTKPRDALIIATKVSGPSHGWIKAAVRSGNDDARPSQHRARCRSESHGNCRPTTSISIRRIGRTTARATKKRWRHSTNWCATGKVRVIGCSNETTGRQHEEPRGFGDEWLRALRDDPEQLQSGTTAASKTNSRRLVGENRSASSRIRRSRVACCRGKYNDGAQPQGRAVHELSPASRCPAGRDGEPLRQRQPR